MARFIAEYFRPRQPIMTQPQVKFQSSIENFVLGPVQGRTSIVAAAGAWSLARAFRRVGDSFFRLAAMRNTRRSMLPLRTKKPTTMAL